MVPETTAASIAHASYRQGPLDAKSRPPPRGSRLAYGQKVATTPLEVVPG